MHLLLVLLLLLRVPLLGLHDTRARQKRDNAHGGGIQQENVNVMDCAIKNARMNYLYGAENRQEYISRIQVHDGGRRIAKGGYLATYNGVTKSAVLGYS